MCQLPGFSQALLVPLNQLDSYACVKAQVSSSSSPVALGPQNFLSSMRPSKCPSLSAGSQVTQSNCGLLGDRGLRKPVVLTIVPHGTWDPHFPLQASVSLPHLSQGA